MGKPEVESYLSHLAVEKHVAVSTQNQAFNALLFLYKNVLHLPFADDIAAFRSKRSPRLPVMLSQKEISHLFDAMQGGGTLLMARLNEPLRLQVQDIGFDYGCLPVHAGKGNKDRTSLLAKALYDDLKAHLHVIRALFDRMGLPLFGCLMHWQENIRTHQERGNGNLFSHPKRYQKTLRMERFVVTM